MKLVFLNNNNMVKSLFVKQKYILLYVDNIRAINKMDLCSSSTHAHTFFAKKYCRLSFIFGVGVHYFKSL